MLLLKASISQVQWTFYDCRLKAANEKHEERGLFLSVRKSLSCFVSSVFIIFNLCTFIIEDYNYY